MSIAWSRAVDTEFLGEEMESSQFPHKSGRGQHQSFPFKKCLLKMVLEFFIHVIQLLILLLSKLDNCLIVTPMIYTNRSNDWTLLPVQNLSYPSISQPIGNWSTHKRVHGLCCYSSSGFMPLSSFWEMSLSPLICNSAVSTTSFGGLWLLGLVVIKLC